MPLSVVRTVPEHYVWIVLEGTPPINVTLGKSSTPLEGGSVIRGIKLNKTGTYTLLAKNDVGNDSITIEVTVMGKDI